MLGRRRNNAYALFDFAGKISELIAALAWWFALISDTYQVPVAAHHMKVVYLLFHANTLSGQ